jgi:protein-disulfide isomerase
MRKLFMSLSCFTAISCSALDYPMLGNEESTIHVVAFLEPKCPDSKRFYLESYPKLKQDYIDTNKISYTIIPTSFLYKSMTASLSLLCAYKQDKNFFFDYLDYIYKNQQPERKDWATKDTLVDYASKANPKINLVALKTCIEHEDYVNQVEENTFLGNLLLGHLSTPTLLVNGNRVENKDDTVDYDNLKEAIDEAIKNSNEKNS